MAEVFVQLVPHGELGATETGFHQRHCYWFKKDAPWQKLLTAWAKENHWHEEDLQLSTSAGALIPLHSTAAAMDGDVSLVIAPRADLAQPPRHRSPNEGDTETETKDMAKIRIVAHCDAGSTMLQFRAPRSIPLRKLMLAWCQRQGLTLKEVIFRLGSVELSPRDPLDKFVTQAELEIVAEPRADADCYVAPPGATEAPKNEASEESRVQVQIAAQGILSERVKEGPTGTRGLSFKTKLFAPLGKVMNLWCKHQGIARDTLQISYKGQELLFDDTAAKHGWSPGEVVVLDAILVSDVAAAQAQARLNDAQKAQKESATTNGLVSVMVLCDNAEPLDFTMKTTTALQKMMVEYRKQRNLGDNVVFRENDQLLSPSDTPRSRGWSRDEMIKVKAFVESPMDSTKVTEVQALEEEKEVKEVGPEGPEVPEAKEPKVTVEVVAADQDSTHTTSFKLRINSPMEKVMNAWCQNFQLEPSEAIFEYNGQRLQVDDTLQKLGWNSSSPTPVIKAIPRKEALQELTTSDSATGSDGKILVNIIAQGEDGRNILDFKMKPTTPFQKALEAWCQHHNMPQEHVIFEFQGAPVVPTMTPDACGWQSSFGILEIEARPKETAGEVNEDKVQIQVLALAETRQITVDFRMKPSSPFEKMMKAWCQHQGLPEHDAIFEFNGRKLTPTDTPASCSWSARDGVMKINATPREVKATGALEEVPGTASHNNEVVNTDSIPSEVEGQVSVQVVADGANGEQVTTFKMKPTTTFRKLMTRWCSHHGVPQDSACFKFGEKEITEDDTWQSLRAGSDEIVIRVSPRSAKRNKRKSEGSEGPTAKRTATAYQLFQKHRRQTLATEQPNLKFGETVKILSAEWKAMSQEERRPFEEDAKKAKEAAVQAAQEAQETQTQEAQETADSSAAEKNTVQVQVVADGADGTSTLAFNMKASTPMKKMMQAWCQHHQVAMEEADFYLGSRLLKLEDTLTSMGCNEGITVRAVPKGEEPPLEPEPAPPETDKAPTSPVPKAVAKPPKAARGRGRGRGSKRKSRGSRGQKSSEEESSEVPQVEPASGARRSKRLQSSDQVASNATLVHHTPQSQPRRKEQTAEGTVPTGEASKRMSFREYLQFDREQEKMRNEARLARQKRKFVNGDSSDEELHLAMALSLSESQGAPGDSQQDSASLEPA